MKRSHFFCKISSVDLSTVLTVKFTVEILQNIVAFSEYMNLKNLLNSMPMHVRGNVVAYKRNYVTQWQISLNFTNSSKAKIIILIS